MDSVQNCDSYINILLSQTYTCHFLRSHLLERWFLARLILDPEDGCDTFFRNVTSHTDYMALSKKKVTFMITAVKNSNLTTN
jgi:hypothetical protein